MEINSLNIHQLPRPDLKRTRNNTGPEALRLEIQYTATDIALSSCLILDVPERATLSNNGRSINPIKSDVTKDGNAAGEQRGHFRNDGGDRHNGVSAACTPNAPNLDGRVAPIVGGAPLIPADECASHHFALTNSMELWLLMYCYDTAIPAPCFFREEKFHRKLGPMYAFNVVIPGNPLGPNVRAKGRYTFLEDDAREDVAFTMLWFLLENTGKEVTDFNYLHAKAL
ncbi:hypothetical protein AHAS_Ahas09G0235300 [Arachis hypogaea]